jgi:hypothetical protein
MKLIDFRTADGSRHFACLPKKASWEALQEHIAQLPGLLVEQFSPGKSAGPCLSFSFRGHRFVVHDGGHEYHFFVRDPRCSDLSLYQLAYQCEQILDRPVDIV